MPKTYHVRLANVCVEEDIGAFERGIELPVHGCTEGRMALTLPAKLHPLDDRKEALVTLTEGRFRQVRKMFERRGNEVLDLTRRSHGGLALDPSLRPGECRHLHVHEREGLYRDCGFVVHCCLRDEDLARAFPGEQYKNH